eukprot:1157727-Pelagomonas_calceolata.AAC.6
MNTHTRTHTQALVLKQKAEGDAFPPGISTSWQRKGTLCGLLEEEKGGGGGGGGLQGGEAMHKSLEPGSSTAARKK